MCRGDGNILRLLWSCTDHRELRHSFLKIHCWGASAPPEAMEIWFDILCDGELMEKFTMTYAISMRRRCKSNLYGESAMGLAMRNMFSIPLNNLKTLAVSFWGGWIISTAAASAGFVQRFLGGGGRLLWHYQLWTIRKTTGETDRSRGEGVQLLAATLKMLC